MMIDSDIASQVLSPPASTQATNTGFSIDPDIAETVMKSPTQINNISAMEAVGRGVTKGVDDFNIAVGSMKLVGKGLTKLGFPTWERKVDAYRESINKNYEEATRERPIATTVGRITGGIGATLPTMAIPGSQLGMAGKTGTLAKSVTQGAGQGAATGALAQDGDLLTNVGVSSALGAGVSGVLTGGGMLLKGAKNVLTGTRRADAPELMSSSAEYKVPLALSDVTKPGIYTTTERNIADNMLIGGNANLRAAQAESYEPAYKKLLQKVAANSDGSYASVKKDMTRYQARLKKVAENKFNKVQTLSKDVGDVELLSTKTAADELLTQAEQGTIKGEYVTRLKAILDKGNIAKGSSASTILNSEGKPIVKATADTKTNNVSFQEMRELRSTIGGEIKALENSATKTNDKILGGYKKLFSAIENDLDNWGTNNPKVAEAYNDAKAFYRGYKDVFNDDIVKAMSDDVSLYNFLSRAATEKNPYSAQQLVNAVGKGKGQEDLKAYILTQAANKATNEFRDQFNPTTFVNEIKRLGDSQGVYFGEQVDAVKGLAKLFDAAKGGFESTQYKSTGVQAVKTAVTLAALGGAAGIGAGASEDKPTGAALGLSTALALGAIARNPKWFVKASRITEKTDPSVASAILNRAKDVARRAGVELPYNDTEIVSGVRKVMPDVVKSHTRNAGSTFDLAGKNMVGQKKYSVSIFPDRGIVKDGGGITDADIESFVKNNADLFRDPRVAIGTWYDESSGKTYIDAVLALDNKNSAVELAKQYNQKAVFDLDKLAEIPTGGTGEAGKYTTMASERIPRSSNVYGSIIGRTSAITAAQQDSE